jgi:S1-C subfamily serine protease
VERRSAVRLVELLVVALIGGAIALGAAAAFGRLGKKETVNQVMPPATTSVGLRAAPSVGTSAESIYKHDAPGVVQITATTVTTTPADPFGFTPPQKETEQSLGSGFVIDKAGHIITNYHVIAGAQKVQVSFSGGDQIVANVVGRDPSTDVAVLKIDTHARALTPLPLGDSDAVRVGDPVYAIGNPFGYTRTLTSGIVSAVQREISAPNNLPIDNAIQTDAAINHGNSGGPLIDAAGRVIGVTSQISTGNTGQQGNVGIGFAVPINTVRTVASQLIKSGTVAHPYLGISVLPISKQLARLFNLPAQSGLLVASVDAGSGAAKAGLRAGHTNVIVQGTTYPLGGDIIIAVDGKPVSTFEQLRDSIAQKKPGDELSVELYRHGQKQTVHVTLGNAPK